MADASQNQDLSNAVGNPNANQTLDDKDNFQIVRNFKGYQNNSDITSTDPAMLVPPSQNVLITGDDVKCVEMRSGYTLLGHAGTQIGNGIRSKYDDFVNGVGIKLPLREWGRPSGSSNIEVFYMNPVTQISDWVPIFNFTNGVHELYFTDWYDDTLILPALIWVDGGTRANYWNGGISAVVSFTTSTITINDQIGQLGFDTSGGFFYVGNHLFTFTTYSGTTFTGVAPDPTGIIAVGDILTQPVVQQPLQYLDNALVQAPTLDIISTLQNQVFYGSYQTRTVYVSNVANSMASTIELQTQTTVDDLVITNGNQYANTTQDTLKFDIVSIPAATQVTSSVQAPTDFQDVNFGYGPLQSGATGNGGLIFNIIIQAGGGTFTWSLNGGSSSVAIPVSISPINLSNNVTVSFGQPGGYIAGDVFTLYIGNTADTSFGNNDYYTVSRLEVTGTPPNLTVGEYVVIQNATPIATPFVYNGVTFTWNLAVQNTPYGHKVGDSWTVELTPAVVNAWADIFSHIPVRLPGEGALAPCDSVPIAFIPQESLMYVNLRSGPFQTIEFQLSSDLLTEKIVLNRIKTDSSNKTLRQGLITNTKDSVAYINIENQLVVLGRVVDQLATPMSEILSLPVKNDFAFIEFIQSISGLGNAHLDYADNKIFVSVPSVGLYWIYDEIYELWNPPQTGSFSAVSVINGQIVAHSSITNESYVLYSSSNDNGQPFLASMYLSYNSDGRFPQTIRMLMIDYEATGRRDRLKEISKFFIEAYKTKNTNLYGQVKLEWQDTGGGPNVRLDPKIPEKKDKASIGKGSLASHGLANDPNPQLTKFHFYQPFNRQFIYETQLGFYTESIDGYFKIVSCGTNMTIADQRNVVAQYPADTPLVPQFPGIPGSAKAAPDAGGVNIPGYVADSNAEGGAS